MMIFKNKKYIRGYTVVELLIAITLMGSMLTLIISSFISKINICGTLDRSIELQQQGFYMLSFIENKILESEGIYVLEDEKKKDKLYTNESTKIYRIAIKNNFNDLNPNDTRQIGYVFNLSKKTEYGYKLLYKNGISGTGSVEIGDYIESIEVEPVPSETNFIDANGIVIRINLILENCRFSAENTFCFRNNSGRF